MRYRAILTDPQDTTAERAKQVFGQHLLEMERWAQQTLENAVGQDAYVTIYEKVETVVAVLPKPAAEVGRP